MILTWNSTEAFHQHIADLETIEDSVEEVCDDWGFTPDMAYNAIMDEEWESWDRLTSLFEWVDSIAFYYDVNSGELMAQAEALLELDFDRTLVFNPSTKTIT